MGTCKSLQKSGDMKNRISLATPGRDQPRRCGRLPKGRQECGNSHWHVNGLLR